MSARVCIAGMALAAGACIAAPLRAQQPMTLVITARDSASGAPLEHVRARLVLSGVSQETNNRGQVVLAIRRLAIDTLVLERIGFAARSLEVTFEPGYRRLTIDMAPIAAQLAPVTVIATQRSKSAIPGWDSRRQRGGGHVITRDEIEYRHPTRTTDLLRNVPGLRLSPGRNGEERARVSRGLTSPRDATMGVCAPRVYLNGAPVENETPPPGMKGTRDLPGQSVLESIRPNEIEAIEVYASAAQVPPEYNGTGSTCGIILIWLRHS